MAEKMDKAALKKVIKPIIKECIREVLMEIGAESLVSEARQPILESKQAIPQPKPLPRNQPLPEKVVEFKKKIVEQIGKSGYAVQKFDPFAGTVPLTETQSHGTSTSPIADPRDPGVDVTSLISANAALWKAHLNPKGK